MLGYLTSRWQSTGDHQKTSPNWFDRHVNPLLLSVAKKACTHPIHTIVTIAFLASYSYLGVLDKGLLESGIEEASSRVDFQTLLAGSKRLRIGEETSWQWEAEENRISVNADKVWPTKSTQEMSLIRDRRRKNSPLSPLSSPNRAPSTPPLRNSLSLAISLLSSSPAHTAPSLPSRTTPRSPSRSRMPKPPTFSKQCRRSLPPRMPHNFRVQTRKAHARRRSG
jgi:hypothetical protein